MQICSNFCNISKLILFGCGNDTTTILVSLKQRAASMWLARARSFLASCVLDEKSFSNYQRISRKAICIRKMNLTRLENGHHPAPDQLYIDKSSWKSLRIPGSNYISSLSKPREMRSMQWIWSVPHSDGGKLFKWPRINVDSVVLNNSNIIYFY